MSSVNDFQGQIRQAFIEFASDVSPTELAERLSLEPTSELAELVDAAIAANKGPTLLQTATKMWPEVKRFAELLFNWEDDANLQDHWAEVASAIDLQRAKAYYTLAEADAEDEQGRVYSRLIRKVSRTLADHPDNAQGEFEIYGMVRVSELLGSEEIATTYKGVHLITEEPYTVKVLKPEFAANTALVESLMAASSRVRDIQHPQIAQVGIPAAADERPRSRTFFLTRWTGGKTLESLIGDEDFSLKARQATAVKICQGLVYVHSKGILHGHIRPTNVLIEDGQDVCLADFLAPTAEAPTQVWPELIKKLGNNYYLAPEVVSGELPTVASEIFSLGRMLFRLFTRKGENLYDVMVPQLFKKELEAHLADYPDLVAILERATALEADERPESVSAVLAELHRLGGHLGVDADDDLSALRADGAWAELHKAQYAKLDEMDEEARLATLEDIAEVQEYVMGDPLLALESWAKIFEFDPASIKRPCELQLERLREDIGGAAAARVIARAIANVLDEGKVAEAEETLRLSLKAAELFDKDADDKLSSVPLYLTALGQDPLNTRAFEALKGIYQEEENHSGLIQLLHGWAEHQPEASEQISVLLQVAELEETALSEPATAAGTYAAIRNLEPGHVEAFESLRRLNRELGRWENLAAILQEEIGQTDEEERRLELMYGRAQVLQSELDRAGEAVELYRDILSVDAEHAETTAALEGLLDAQLEQLEVARLLEPIYRSRDDWSKLAIVLEVLLTEISPDDDKWVNTLREVANIREVHESNVDEAFHCLARIHRARPNLFDVWGELERTAELCAEPRWGELIALYRNTVETHQQEEKELNQVFVISLWSRVGDLYGQVNDVDGGIEAFLNVLEVDPHHVEALGHIEALYATNQRWEELVEILQIKRDMFLASEDTANAYEVLRMIAALKEEQLQDSTSAVHVYVQALVLNPDGTEVVADLERLSKNSQHTVALCSVLEPHYEQRSEWEPLLNLISRRLKLDSGLDEPQRAKLLAQMGMTADEKLDEPRRAFELYVKSVSANHEDDEVQALLENVAERINAWQSLVDFYDRLLSSNTVTAPERRESMLLKIAAWYRDRLAQPDNAEAKFRQVLESWPEHPQALDSLEELYEKQGLHPQLYEILAKRVDLTGTVDDRKVILFRMARLSAEALDNVQGAIDAYQEIAGLDEQDHQALDALAQIYEDQGNHGALIDTLRQRAQGEEDPAERISILARMGSLARYQINDVEAAREYFEQAWQLEPADPRKLLQALSEVYISSNDLPAWFSLLPHCIEHAESDDERVGLELWAATLAVRPGAPEDADPATHYESVLTMQPHHPQALLALEEVYNQRSQWEELKTIYRLQFVSIHLKAADLAFERLSDPKGAVEHLEMARRYQPDSADLMERLIVIHSVSNNWDEVVTLMQEKVKKTEDPNEQSRILCDLGTACEKGGKNLDAIESFIRALDLNPRMATALLELNRLAISSGQYDRLVPPVVERLQETEIGPEIGPIIQALEHVELAAAGGAGGDLASVVSGLQSVIIIDDLPVETGVDLMRPVFEVCGAEPEMAEALIELANELPAATESRAKMLRVAAEMYEVLGEPDKALDFYCKAFLEYPILEMVERHMFRLGEGLGRLDETLQIIEDRLEQGVDDTDTALALSLTLARRFDVEQAEQTQMERAVSHYQRALSQSPGQPECLAALNRLHRELGNWEQLRKILGQRVDSAKNAVEQATFRLNLAILLVRQFEEHGSAIDLCTEVMLSAKNEVDTNRVRARELVEGVLETQKEANQALYLKAFDVLKEEYSRIRDRGKLIALLESKVELLQGNDKAEERQQLLRQMADVSSRFGEDDPAFEYAVRAIREVPTTVSALDEIEELVERIGWWHRLVDFFNQLLSDPEKLTDEIRLRLSLKRSSWLDIHVDLPEEAAAGFKQVLELDPNNVEALAALDSLFSRLHNDGELFEVLIRRAALASDPDEKQGILTRAAVLANTKLENADAAITCYQQILEEFGATEEVLANLAQLFETAERHKELVSILELQAQAAEQVESPEASELYLRIGELSWAELADVNKTVEAYEKALQATSTREEALSLLAQVFVESENWSAFVQLVQGQMESLTDQETHLSLRLTAAHVALEQLAEEETAYALLVDAKRVSPNHAGATEALYQLLEHRADWPTLKEWLEQDFERQQDDPDAQLASALRLAQLAVDPDALGDSELAWRSLDAAMAIDEEDSTAALLAVKLHLQEGNRQAATKLLGQLLETVYEDEPRTDILVSRGDLLVSEPEHLDDALEDYTTAFQLAPSRADVVERLAGILAEKEGWNDLIRIYEQHIEALEDVGEKCAVALKIAALIRDKDLSLEQLMVALKRAYELDPPFPENVHITLQLANAAHELGTLDDVAPQIESALEVLSKEPNKPLEAALWYYRGLNAGSQGDMAGSIEAHEHCHKLNMNHLPNIIALSHLLFQTKEWEKSLNMLQICMLRQSDLTEEEQVNVFYMMGMAWAQQGDRRRATDMFKRVLAIDSSHLPSVEALERLGD